MKIRLFSTDFVLLAVSGLLAGFANGLLGAGGGIVVTYALARLLRDGGESSRDVFANVVAAMLPMTAISALTYFLKGQLDISEASPFLLPAVIGGILGAVFLGKIDTLILKKIFAVLVLVSGARMLM